MEQKDKLQKKLFFLISENASLHDPTLTIKDIKDKRIAEIKKALERIKKGSYGYCQYQGCGMPIERKRLEAKPQIYSCLNCARKHG